MFCDVGADMGLMGLNLEDYGIERFITSFYFLMTPYFLLFSSLPN